MKHLLLLIFALFSLAAGTVNAQVDPPSGYTVYHGFRMWDEGDYPTSDSVNQNLIDIDTYLYKVESGYDSLKTAFKRLHNFPYGDFNDTVYVFGTQYIPSPQPFYFGTYQSASPLNFMTTGITRMTIDGDGNVTAPGDFVVGDITVNSKIIIDGEYSSAFTFRQDSDENWLMYPGATSEIIFGNTDAPTWFTINAGAYKTQGTTGYLASVLGSITASGLYLANAPSGSTTTQLNYVTLTINGVTRNFLVTN